MREIKILQELDHENVIKVQYLFELPESEVPPSHLSLATRQLCDVYCKYDRLCLVLEVCAVDLGAILHEQHRKLLPSETKAIMLMFLGGLAYMHHNWVLHRDLKPNNLFLTAEGVLKIADFGLTTFFGSPTRDYSSDVVTWPCARGHGFSRLTNELTIHRVPCYPENKRYRAPELLFGEPQYGESVDMWAVGSIFCELHTGVVLHRS